MSIVKLQFRSSCLDIGDVTMTKQLDLFIKSQASDLEVLDDMVSYQPSSQLDWDIQVAIEAGDWDRVHELNTIKHDMSN